MSRRRWSLLSVAAAALLSTGCGPEGKNATVRLATTTSARDSGLLAALLPPFTQQTGYDVHVLAMGTGQALALARRGDADLVLVHARAQEDAFVASGHGIDRRDVMWNDFVIAGPPGDPARIRGMVDPVPALRAIFHSGARFLSRGDDSGTHQRERALWATAGLDPEGEPFYEKAGQGMGKTLTVADERGSYLLVDRGTLLAYEGRIDLVVGVEGHESLVNTYGGILVNPERHAHVNHQGARALLDYLTSEAGQSRIEAFRVAGEVLFHPARPGEPASSSRAEAAPAVVETR